MLEVDSEINWVNEPSEDELNYISKVADQAQKDKNYYEKLLSITDPTEKEVLEQINLFYEITGTDQYMQSITLTKLCYEADCKACGQPLTSWSDSYYGVFKDGSVGYVCVDRSSCSLILNTEALKHSLKTE